MNGKGASTASGDGVKPRVESSAPPDDVAGDHWQHNNVHDGLVPDPDLYRQLFSNARIGLLRTRFSDGLILACNDRAAQLLGFSDRKALGTDAKLADYYADPGDRAVLLEQLKKEGVVRGHEARFRRRDGAVVWLRVSVEWNEERQSIEGIIEDVTDRKHAEIARRDSEERLRAIFESAADYVFVKDRQLRYTHANPAMARLFGTTTDELIGVSDEQLFEPAVARRVRASDERALAGETVEESNVSRIKGVDHVFHTVKVPLRNADGEVVALCGIARDITELKRAETVERVMGSILHVAVADVDLRTLIVRIRELLHELIDTTNFFVALYDDTTGRYSFPYYADEYDQLERYEPEPLPKSLTDYVRRTGKPLFADESTFRRLEAAGDVGLVGTNSQQWLGAPLTTDRGVIGVVVVQSYRDGELYTGKDLELLNYAAHTISIAVERKRADEVRRAMSERILRGQKMESLATLAGGLSHEFNNLLQSILGSSGLAAQMVPPSSPILPQLRAIEKAADAAAGLTRQMRAFAGEGRFIVEDLDFSAEVEEAVRFLQPLATEAIDLRLDLDRDLPPISADASEIRQLVSNLVTNAAEAMAEGGGQLEVKTSLEQRSRVQLESAILGEDLQPGTYVVLEVSDTGTGMHAETLAKIFDPFFSTKFTGRGLGLAAVLGIVRANGGAIRVESSPGSGTAVRVYLPVHGARFEVPDPSPHTAAEIVTGATVMVVDDDESIRDLSREMLEQAGFEVVTASDGVVAVDKLSAAPNAIDAVLLDMTMPRMSGEETYDAMMAIRPGLPVVFASGYSEMDANVQREEKYPSAYLQKPYRLKDLLTALNEVGVSV